MNVIENLDEIISEYYDNELSKNKKIQLEAKFANSKIFEEYSEKMCYSFFKISNSIKLVKIRAKNLNLNLQINLKSKNKKTISQQLFRFFQAFQ